MYNLIYEKGKRERNEDSYRVLEQGAEKIYLVADGCGGYSAGDVASQMAVDYLAEYFMHNPCNEDTIKAAVKNCNDLINKEQSRYGAMKTTIVGLIKNGDTVFAFNVGDSRLYQIRNGNVIFNTEDHAIPYVLYKAGIIDRKEINTHEDRNKILEALGAKTTIKINIYKLEVKKEDIFFLASDGCWEHIYDEDFSGCKKGYENEWIEAIRDIITKDDDEEQDNYTGLLIGDIDEQN